MSERVFFDTNVLLYAEDDGDAVKRDRATELIDGALRSAAGVVSTQVLQEYFVNATRKLGLTAAQARGRIEAFAAFDVVVVKPDLIFGAIDLHRLQALSFWDALVVKCAAASACDVLLTEDLQDGQILDGVRIRNPFRT